MAEAAWMEVNKKNHVWSFYEASVCVPSELGAKSVIENWVDSEPLGYGWQRLGFGRCIG
jgi:hypothetical protein